MPATDARGLSVSGADTGATAAVDYFVSELLGNGAEPTAVMEAAEAHPRCPLLQAYAASLYVFAQSPSGAAPGLRWLERAQAQSDHASEHERAFMSAVEAGLRGDLEAAIDGHEAIAKQWPRETVSAKLAEFHLFETGDCRRQRRIMQAFAEANPDDSDVLAMHAFSHELNADADESERVATKALEIDPDTPWAEHCLAHVYARRGEIDRGIGELSTWAPRWESKSQYIRSHNNFHLASLHLSRREFEKPVALLGERIWGVTPEAVVEHTDAILLLWYLELAGAAVPGGSWGDIAARIEGNSREYVFPFLSVMYLFALARAGAAAEAARLMDGFERHAEKQSGRAHQVWHTVGLGLARATQAYAEGRWDDAAAGFAPLLERSGEGGGSDEQRGVFDQSYLISLINGGEREQAREWLNGKIGPREPTPLEQHWSKLAES